MLIKFFRNGQGGGSGPVDYLVERDVVAYDQSHNAIRDERGEIMLFAREPLPEVLRGDADRMRALIDAAGENERGAIKTTIKKAFDWARSDEQRSFLSASTCSLENLFEGLADLFMVVPLDQVDAQAVFLRLLANIILCMAVRLEGAKKPKRKVLLVLDEFVRLGRMEKLINIANVAAGCGIEALFITQDQGQIESVSGKGDTASILGSCVTTCIFGLGRAEFETANWAANALGDQTVLTRTKQSSAKFAESRKTSTAEQRQKLMTADQILEMKTGKMLLLAGSKPPALVDAIVSHRHPVDRGNLDRKSDGVARTPGRAM